MIKKTIFKIVDMHCTSCSMQIDGELEEAEGIIAAYTSYPKQQTEVSFDPALISPQRIQGILKSLGYTAMVAKSN